MDSEKDINLENLFNKLYDEYMLSESFFRNCGFTQHIHELDIGVRIDLIGSIYGLVIIDRNKLFLGKIKYGI